MFRGHNKINAIRDFVESDFPVGFYEGCIFHTFFSPTTALRSAYATQVGERNDGIDTMLDSTLYTNCFFACRQKDCE